MRWAGSNQPPILQLSGFAPESYLRGRHRFANLSPPPTFTFRKCAPPSQSCRKDRGAAFHARSKTIDAADILLFPVKTEMNLNPVMEKLVLHWGEMGARWGISRMVAQIHALLHFSAER